jgi:CRISPR-associated endoribonuclease Cas6
VVLASFLVFLRPRSLAPLGRTVGRSLHGLLLDLVRQADPALAEALHAEAPVKPFTVSMLEGRFVSRGGRLHAAPEEAYRVRYTVLAEPVFAALGHVLLGKQLYRQPVAVDGVPYDVVEIVAEPQRSGGWARLANYAQVLEEARPAPRIGLDFASPTTFRQGDANLLFPLPVSVFGSLLRRWQALAPIPVEHEGLLDFVAEKVVAERYALQTRVVAYGGFQLNGFVGRCQYRVLAADPARTKVLNALAAFALFAGTGQKTTQGMGQTRPVPPE